jgi:Tol biopolymer transport system component
MKNKILCLSVIVFLIQTGCNPAKPVSTPSVTLFPPMPANTPSPSPALKVSSDDGVIAYTSWRNSNWQVYLMNPEGSGQTQVTVNVKGGYEPNWSPDGTKLVFQYSGFWVANIVSGEISPIPLSVKSNKLPNEYLVKPSWSPDGEWLAFLNEGGTQGDIYLIRPDGTDLKRLTDSNDVSRDGNLVWSPDGKQLAYSAARDGNIEIYIMDVEKTLQGNVTSQQLTDSPSPVRNLVTSWSTEGSRIAFSSDRDGNMEIYIMYPDDGDLVRLTNNPASDAEPDWSPDGKQIVFSSNRDGNIDIYVVKVEEALQGGGDASVRRLTDHPDDDTGPRWKPAAIISSSSAGLALEVLQGIPPTLDGVLSPSEWDSAIQQQFTNGGDLFLMQNSGYLYLGMHENIDGLTITSVCLEREDEISILHSSGSLGTAIFKRDYKGWQLTRPFKWDLYGVTQYTSFDEQKRKAFLKNNGWLANLGSMTGTEEIENQIAIPEGPFRMAVAYLMPPNFSKAAWWPVDLADDCRKIELLQANIAENLNTPLLLQFAPDTWAAISIP